jgi:hypothetical protein
MAKRQFVRVVFEGDSLSAPPSRWEIFSDQAFKGTTWFCTLAIILLLFFILYEIGKEALPAIGKYGVSFLTSQTWDANNGQFGILPRSGAPYTVLSWHCLSGGAGDSGGHLSHPGLSAGDAASCFQKYRGVVGGDSQRGLWLMRNLRPYSADPALLRLDLCTFQLDPFFRHHPGGTGDAAGRPGPGHYDPAHRGRDLPGCAAGHPL